MPIYAKPGVYVEEIETGAKPVAGVSTGITAFIGRASKGPVLEPTPVSSPGEFRSIFGELIADPISYLGYAVDAYFANGGRKAYIVRVVSDGATDDLSRPADLKKGFDKLKGYEGISLVAAPGADSKEDQQALIDHCEGEKYRFAILDPAKNADADAVIDQRGMLDSRNGYAALYYPWISMADPATQSPVVLPPSGVVAGIYARTAADRGVHKAPANETIIGAIGLSRAVSPADQSRLNPAGVNVLRPFPGKGIVVWGARTIASDTLWKYVNIRLLFNYIEESVVHGTRWAVFEPCNEKLWARLAQTVSEFLTMTWRDGALVGTTPEQAFLVRCDRTTMTQDDIDNGRTIILIGLAPMKPAEFVIFRVAIQANGKVNN